MRYRPGVETLPSQLLATAIALGALLVGTLSGIWLGFRICTRDAALLARFATEAREARALSEATASAHRVLREEWEATADQIERKRKQTAASASKAAQRDERATATAEAAAAPPLHQLSPRERRRLVQRRITNGGGMH